MGLEKYIWSLDISTTNIGAALFSDKGKLIELKHLELKNDKDVSIENRDIHKCEIFKEYCITHKNRIENDLNGEIIHIIVEAPLQNTPVNINTTALLLGFNGMARYILYEVFNLMPIKISVYESRKLFLPELVSVKYVKGEKKETLSFPEKYKNDKKRYIWEKVAKNHPEIVWIYKKNSKEPKNMCYDMADAFTCGYSGMVQLGIIKK